MVGKEQGPAGSIPPAGAKSRQATAEAPNPAINRYHRSHETHL